MRRIAALALALAVGGLLAPTAAADKVKVKIGIVTWNLAETTQKNDAVNDLIKGADLDSCDIIVVGEQETATAKKHEYLPQRIAEKLGKEWYWADPDGKDKNCRTDIGKSRKTATATVGSRMLTCGVAWNRRVNTWKLQFDNEVVEGKRKGLVFYTAKGGCVVYMDVGERRLGFISCHLNDESSSNRDSEIADIMKTVDKSDTDAVFLMGDLNYRPYGYEGKDLPSADDVCDQLAKDMRKFYETYDPFGRKESVLRQKHGFDLARTEFLPTYKRKMEGIKDMPKKPKKDDLLGYYDFPGLDAKGKKAKKDKDVVTRTAAEVKKKRKAQKEFAIGWLDRIAWKEDGENDAKVKPLKYDSLPNVGVSDHAPVYLVVEVEMDLVKPER